MRLQHKFCSENGFPSNSCSKDERITDNDSPQVWGLGVGEAFNPSTRSCVLVLIIQLVIRFHSEFRQIMLSSVHQRAYQHPVLHTLANIRNHTPDTNLFIFSLHIPTCAHILRTLQHSLINTHNCLGCRQYDAVSYCYSATRCAFTHAIHEDSVST